MKAIDSAILFLFSSLPISSNFHSLLLSYYVNYIATTSSGTNNFFFLLIFPDISFILFKKKKGRHAIFIVFSRD